MCSEVRGAKATAALCDVLAAMEALRVNLARAAAMASSECREQAGEKGP